MNSTTRGASRLSRLVSPLTSVYHSAMSTITNATTTAARAAGLARPRTIPKLIREVKTRRFYIAATKSFSGTLKTATRFSCFDEAEETLEDLGLLGRDTQYQIVDAPESARVRAQIKREEAKAAKAAKGKGKKKRDPRNPGIVQNADGTSFGIVFVKRNGRERMSERYFATQREASHHAERFQARHRHRAYRLVNSRTPVNSWINWITGNSNPKMGKAKAVAAQ